jgi:integrase
MGFFLAVPLVPDGTGAHGSSIWLDTFSKNHDLPHIHPHAFRHTVASTMIADGIDLVTAAGELGHADATTTAKIYAHQIAEAKAKAAEVRSNVFARAK